MHDALIVVRNVVSVDHVPVVFIEVEKHLSVDVLGQNTNVAIPVGSSLLVVEAQGVPELVSDRSFLKSSKASVKLLEKKRKSPTLT